MEENNVKINLIEPQNQNKMSTLKPPTTLNLPKTNSLKSKSSVSIGPIKVEIIKPPKPKRPRCKKCNIRHRQSSACKPENVRRSSIQHVTTVSKTWAMIICQIIVIIFCVGLIIMISYTIVVKTGEIINEIFANRSAMFPQYDFHMIDDEMVKLNFKDFEDGIKEVKLNESEVP